jgi:hypothetical protein
MDLTHRTIALCAALAVTAAIDVPMFLYFSQKHSKVYTPQPLITTNNYDKLQGKLHGNE